MLTVSLVLWGLRYFMLWIVFKVVCINKYHIFSLLASDSLRFTTRTRPHCNTVIPKQTILVNMELFLEMFSSTWKQPKHCHYVRPACGAVKLSHTITTETGKKVRSRWPKLDTKRKRKSWWSKCKNWILCVDWRQNGALLCVELNYCWLEVVSGQTQGQTDEFRQSIQKKNWVKYTQELLFWNYYHVSFFL